MKDKRQTYIDFVMMNKSLSKCTDKKTASVLVSKDLTRLYSIGINGGPVEGRQCLCDVQNTRKYTCAHSEMNCLVKNTVVDEVPKIMICSKQPCQICATLMVNSCTNIQEVWYIEPYWDSTGLEILKEAGIKVEEVKSDYDA